MRKRDPRRLLVHARARARERTRAVVAIRRLPQATATESGAVTTRQLAEVTLPRSELERLWTPENLERLAATYWRYLTRVSAGLLRVVHTSDTREIVLVGRPLVLLRFRAPHYDLEPSRGAVTWSIEGGALVAPAGRGRGFLRLVVERSPEVADDRPMVRVCSEVVNFYPLLAFGASSWASKLGRLLYAATQLQLHVLVTHGFLRSLKRLELVPSSVGALRGPQPQTEPLQHSATR